jgi:hypothetical protein
VKPSVWFLCRIAGNRGFLTEIRIDKSQAGKETGMTGWRGQGSISLRRKLLDLLKKVSKTVGITIIMQN